MSDLDEVLNYYSVEQLKDILDKWDARPTKSGVVWIPKPEHLRLPRTDWGFKVKANDVRAYLRANPPASCPPTSS